MTKEQRHEIIMETLIRQGSVLVSDLVEMLEVSAVTVRKDLTELERGDRLYRSHGKAVLINPYINNRSVNEKEKLATDEKHAIGREAARLITRDDSIVIASGTTVHALARNIQPLHKLTVVSASLAVSNILTQHENIDIMLTAATTPTDADGKSRQGLYRMNTSNLTIEALAQGNVSREGDLFFVAVIDKVTGAQRALLGFDKSGKQLSREQQQAAIKTYKPAVARTETSESEGGESSGEASGSESGSPAASEGASSTPTATEAPAAAPAPAPTPAPAPAPAAPASE